MLPKRYNKFLYVILNDVVCSYQISIHIGKKRCFWKQVKKHCASTDKWFKVSPFFWVKRLRRVQT